METCYYMNDVLDTIHSIIKLNNVRLDDESRERADIEIQDYIKERLNIVSNKKGIVLSSKYKDLKIPRNTLIDIMLQYYAIANDNLRLLEILKGRNFVFTESNRIKLFLLDKEFASKFPFNKYIDLLVKEDIVFRRFYGMIHTFTDEDKNKYTEMFSDVICTKPNICIDNSKSDTYDEGFLTSLLTPRNLDFFGKDFLLNSTLNQRRVIDSLGSHLKVYELNKVKELLEKYPDFDCKIQLSPELLGILSADEIAGMSDKDAFLYGKVMSKGYNLIDRLHNILDLNPDFVCSESFLRPEIFKSLTDEEIAGLTPKGVEEIENIRIPLIENVYVMPIRKINRAVAKDNRLKKKLAKEEAKMHR